MNSWVDLHALWRIIVVGLICGAGLPALFAVGLYALNLPGSRAQLASADSEQIVGGSRVGLAAATICFAVVLAAIGWGIYLIVSAS